MPDSTPKAEHAPWPNPVSPDAPLLFEAPDGDVLAARAAAGMILKGVSDEEDAICCARLFLTATLLQCAICDGQGVTRPALLAHLNALARSGLPGAGLRTSRLPFCRYAAAEVDGLTPMQRRQLITTLLAAADLHANYEARDNYYDNDNQVRI